MLQVNVNRSFLQHFFKNLLYKLFADIASFSLFDNCPTIIKQRKAMVDIL